MRAPLIWMSLAVLCAALCAGLWWGFGALQGVREQSFLVGPLEPGSAFALCFGLGGLALTIGLLLAWWRATAPGPRVILGLSALLAVLLTVPLTGVVALGALLGHDYVETTAAPGRNLVLRLGLGGGVHVYERSGMLISLAGSAYPSDDARQHIREGEFELIPVGEHFVIRWGDDGAWFRIP